MDTRENEPITDLIRHNHTKNYPLSEKSDSFLSQPAIDYSFKKNFYYISCSRLLNNSLSSSGASQPLNPLSFFACRLKPAAILFPSGV